MTRFVTIILLLSTISLQAQQIQNTEKYVRDFDSLIVNLISTHPDPYTAFGDVIGFYREKQKAREEIINVKSDEEFVFLLNKFVSRLADGHTFINKPSIAGNDETKYLPLKFRVASDKLFIQNTTEEFKAIIGKPIASINGIKIDSLLNLVKLYYPTENISGSYSNLINILRNDISEREFFGDTGNKVKLIFEETSATISIDIPYLKEIKWLVQAPSIILPNENGWINWAMIGKEKKIAYFQWNSTISREYLDQVYRDSPQNIEGSLQWIYSGILKDKRTSDLKRNIEQVPALYEQFYLMLREMKTKSSKFLIIDLRNNSGGMTPLIKPLLYILYGDKYINFDFHAEYFVKLSPLLLHKYNITINQYNNGNKTDYVVGDYNSYAFGNIEGDSYLDKVKQVENGYQGFGTEFVKKSIELNIKPHIIVLTSINTFSAAFHFTYFLKKLGNTSIIGVAPKQAGNSFMESTQFELPETKIKGSISNSMQVLFKNDSQTGKLLHPDFEMNWNVFFKYKFDNEAEVLNAIDLIETGKIITP